MDAMDERLQMANELITILGSNDSENLDYESMHRTATSWQADCEEVHRQVKETIRALTKELETEQEKVDTADAAIKDELKKQNEELTASEELNSQLSQQVSTLRKTLKDTKKNAENLAMERSKKAEENTHDLTSLRYKVNLYHHVANIQWDYNAGADDVRGYITNKDKVTPFQMSTKQNSRFFIANHLWDLMESNST